MSNKDPDITPKKELKSKINKLLLIISLTVAFTVVVLCTMLISINLQYNKVLLCANTAADFNKEFKQNIDLEMYNHVISPRSDNPVSTLPMEELTEAESVLTRLSETTSLPDNKWRVRSMLDMCKNLRTYMIEIAETESYDQRMLLLEKNIRGETGLTLLIEQYMHEYIDDEVRHLSQLSSRIKTQSTILIITVTFVLILLAVLILYNSVKMVNRITHPLEELSKKASRFGRGNFTSSPIYTNILELETLNQNLDKMAVRINSLIEKQIEDERSLHRAELELLQAQINPHFLYNTLDSIAILAESEREEDVVTMVTSLSTFFRNSLNSGQDIIPLRAEIAQVRSYLEIQQIRYSDIMSYSIDIPESILEIKVPKLILQPLIENALYHGIKNRRGRGTIEITGEIKNGMILLKVADNGAGMTPEQLHHLQSGKYQEHHSGLGLKNVNQRIRLYFGNVYGISFESTLGEGTTATISLPENGITYM